MPITRLSPQLLKTGSNGTLLITASNALTASYALNATAGGVTSVTAGSGLSGGTITSTGTIALDTGSTHFISGSINVLNNKTVISSSGQVSYTGLSNVPVGIISSSGQVSYTGLSNTPTGIISSSTQFRTITDPFTGSFTGSHTGTFPYASLTGTPTGIVSSSGQVSYTGLSNTPVGIVSSSTQFTSTTAPFTGSFTGSLRGNLIGTSSWAESSSRAITASFALAGAGGGVTINNNTDNYIVTATGTANTLNGEVALQFDGTTRRLAVSGSISSSGAIYLQTGSTLFLGGTGTPATKQVSGGPEAISFQPGATNNVLLWSGLPSDTEGRFLISTNGFTEWGAGGANDQDIALFRNGIGNVSVQSFNTSSLSTFAVYTSQSQEVFAVDTQLARRRVRINGAVGGGTLDISGSSGGIPVLRIEAPSVNDIGMSSLVTGDSFVRFYFAPDGDMYWGPGSAVADIQLYRPTTRNLAVIPVGGDSTSTFRVLNSAGSTNVFNVDTTNTRVGVGTATPTHTLQVVGDISSSGLVTQAVSSSVSPVYNVRAWGARGDGTTDDYTAINAALTAITAAGGGTLYLPKGNYRIGTGLRITSNTNIKGDGVQNTIINCNHLTTLPGTAMISGSDIDRVVIEDLCLSGSGINGASSIGIRFTLNTNVNTSNVILRNLFVNDQAGTGISIATPILTTLQNVKVRFTAGDGFSVSNGTSTNFYECFAVTGLGAGFNLDTMTYSSLVGCAAEVYGISYRFNNCSAISVVSCGSEDPIDRSSTNPGYTGIAYRNSEVSTTSRVSLISCYSRDPRTPAPNGHISGSFQTFNFRAQSGSQVLTPFKLYGNSEFVGQLSASAYTSSITNGIGFVGSASYANSISGYLNFPSGLRITGSTQITAGALGVNVTASATNGRIDASNDIVAFSSDRRLKTNIEQISNPLQKIQSLTGFTYNWNELANNVAGFETQSRYVGVFAQEVQTVIPEAVKVAPFDNDGTDKSISGENYLTVQYEKLVPLLIEAIKELKAEVDELRGKSE